MERLTKKYSDGTHGASEDLPCGENSYAYKNLLIEKLGKYEDLEEQGRLIKLPCKVGDTVYALNKTKREIFPSRVEHIEYVVNDNLDFPLTKIKGEGFCVFFDDFGKIVFLTKEEAEQKLKEMESD